MRETFDPDTLHPTAPNKVTFVAPGHQQLKLLPKGCDGKKIVVNGEVVTTPPEIIAFENFTFICDKDSVEEGRVRASKLFLDGVIRDADEMARRVEETQVNNIVDALKGNEALAAKVMVGLKRATTQAPQIEATT
jgi:hypothetical protein